MCFGQKTALRSFSGWFTWEAAEEEKTVIESIRLRWSPASFSQHWVCDTGNMLGRSWNNDMLFFSQDRADRADRAVKADRAEVRALLDPTADAIAQKSSNHSETF